MISIFRNFLLLCTRSHTADLRRNVPRLSSPQNLISPGNVHVHVHVLHVHVHVYISVVLV